jgi:hypothetical protein
MDWISDVMKSMYKEYKEKLADNKIEFLKKYMALTKEYGVFVAYNYVRGKYSLFNINNKYQEVYNDHINHLHKDAGLKNIKGVIR